ncbi:hypothetical protein B0T26DRAFT_537486 [Lasiosphaeria miniovina]|uniref:Uncharacterized protein n=1 Tax=Lasiosphaeria miniovina TaxID=1954250 RepID=A0AA39ZR12_9PEZI|nr:uncharacterized protein B0T26DRAFT_537486 [Lasiosphaeria miniovina]KAK0701964.1 hypothetical protein B0T26DRAFT_537486 [Lasiosphaeria miniovina]
MSDRLHPARRLPTQWPHRTSDKMHPRWNPSTSLSLIPILSFPILSFPSCHSLYPTGPQQVIVARPAPARAGVLLCCWCRLGLVFAERGTQLRRRAAADGDCESFPELCPILAMGGRKKYLAPLPAYTLNQVIMHWFTMKPTSSACLLLYLSGARDSAERRGARPGTCLPFRFDGPSLTLGGGPQAAQTGRFLFLPLFLGLSPHPALAIQLQLRRMQPFCKQKSLFSYCHAGGFCLTRTPPEACSRPKCPIFFPFVA